MTNKYIFLIIEKMAINDFLSNVYTNYCTSYLFIQGVSKMGGQNLGPAKTRLIMKDNLKIIHHLSNFNQLF